MKDQYPPVVIGRMPLMVDDPGPAAKNFIQPNSLTEELEQLRDLIDLLFGLISPVHG